MSSSKKDDLHKSDLKTHKRKRSYSGIELPSSSTEEIDDFQAYKIAPEIVERLKLKQITSLFEVQKKVYNPIYEGKNVIVASLTGSGKTLAFVLPTLMHYLDNKEMNQTNPKILVLAPTRELSIQTGREYSDLSTKNLLFKTVLVYGGVSMEDQIDKLKSGCDIIVGTPGRVVDMIERGHLKVDKIKTLILDEADKMLDMGFEESITDIYNKIIINNNKDVNLKEKKNLQILLFSATIEDWVRKVARKIIPNKDEMFIDLVKDLGNKTPKTVTHLAVQVIKSEKTTTIADLILCYGGKNKSTLVFVNTKKECSDLMISDKIKEDIKSKIRGLRVISTSDGCVFDFPEDDKEIFENILYNDKYYGVNYALDIPEDLPELQSLEEQRNRDSNNINLNTGNNINNLTGGFRPKNTSSLKLNSANRKAPQLLDHSKFAKRKGKFDIFVGNLPYGTDEVKLKEWFEKNGMKNMEFDVRIVIDKDTGKGRGFGFVSVFKKEDISDVIKLNGKEFNYRKLIINESKK